MEWRHYEVRDQGTALVLDKDGVAIDATYSLGLVSTGRSRVFAGYFVKLILATGTEFMGEDEHSLRPALWQLASSLSSVGLELRCSGLDQRWRESGLSVDTGWGYFMFYPEAVHMMAAVPEAVRSEGEALDREISEAVSNMRIGVRLTSASIDPLSS